jgi:hypothetical protein
MTTAAPSAPIATSSEPASRPPAQGPGRIERQRKREPRRACPTRRPRAAAHRRDAVTASAAAKTWPGAPSIRTAPAIPRGCAWPAGSGSHPNRPPLAPGATRAPSPSPGCPQRPPRATRAGDPRAPCPPLGAGGTERAESARVLDRRARVAQQRHEPAAQEMQQNPAGVVSHAALWSSHEIHRQREEPVGLGEVKRQVDRVVRADRGGVPEQRLRARLLGGVIRKRVRRATLQP